MKVLVINGSPNQHGCTDTALSEVEAQLHREGIETERYWVGRQPVPGCIACNHCAGTGKCIFHDGVNDLAARTDEFDALVVGSPVYYAGASGQVCCFLDRLFYVTGGTWAGKPGAAVVDVGINRVDGKVVGDVDFAAVSQVAGWISPVPGGVGKMTIGMLMESTIAAAEKRGS